LGGKLALESVLELKLVLELAGLWERVLGFGLVLDLPWGKVLALRSALEWKLLWVLGLVMLLVQESGMVWLWALRLEPE
jgi:hypothetical protein